MFHRLVQTISFCGVLLAECLCSDIKRHSTFRAGVCAEIIHWVGSSSTVFVVTRKGLRAVPLPFGSLLVSYVDAFTLLSPSPEPKEQDLPGAGPQEAFAGFDRGRKSLYLRSKGFLVFLKVHQQGKAKESVPKIVRGRQQPRASVLLVMEGKRDGMAAWHSALPKLNRPCCPTSLQRLQSASLADCPNRGGKTNGLKRSQVLGHVCEQSVLET